MRCSSVQDSPVYEGMIIGEHSRENDLEVNPIESQAADQHSGPPAPTRAVRLAPPRASQPGRIAIAYIDDDDELLGSHAEYSCGCASGFLNPHDRKRADAQSKAPVEQTCCLGYD